VISYLRSTHDGEPVVAAMSDVDVGIDARSVTVTLGPWPEGAADPGGPLGLDSTPLVVLMGDADVELVGSGVRRASREAAMERLRPRADLGLELLAAVGRGAEVLVVDGGGADELRLARALGAQTLVALPFGEPAAIGAFARDLDLDVHVVVPAHDDRTREQARSVLEPFALERLHHLVEVDPGPSFDELGRDLGAADLDMLAAGAAGVLGGRLAVRNRRWRAQLAE
jgi:hypothetical protein